METWFQKNEDRLWETAQVLFAEPELALEEERSSRRLGMLLEAEGFAVTYGVGGLPTAFLAQWGSGRPVLGFLAEYDALPGMGQAAVPRREPLPGCGHACGHHLLGTALAGAAMALKAAMEEQRLAGTLLVYGCPAEEVMCGKVTMLANGCFGELDAALTWHPDQENKVNEDIWLAKDTRRFQFYGTPAHAAAAPELGRSALDAAELMNVGANYLREHIPEGVRLHYVYTDGGGVPNIVPPYAETEYYIRGRDGAAVEAVRKRLEKVAAGAAMMTETRVESKDISRCPETRLNQTLNRVFYQAMAETPLPRYSDEDLAFAAAIRRENGWEDGKPAFTGLLPLTGDTGYFMASTDASAVSQVCPLAFIRVATACAGTPLHHWAFAAQGGGPIGRKGMLYAARALARGGLRLLTDPGVLEAAWAEHRREKE